MKKGFTLTELTVVIGILSIIILIVTQPVTNIIKYQRDSQQSDNVRDNVQFILNIIDKELRTSSDISSATPSELTFKDQDGIDVTYSLSAANIIKKNDGQPTEQDYSDPSIFTVDNITFSINDGGVPNSPGTIVTVVITATSVDGTDTVTMQSTTMPRNN
jgi:prepilin-type N-terminal cleavage/methylation domain-containing protein